MTRPSPLDYALAALMIAVSVYCAARLAAAPVMRRSVGRDVDLSHAAMGAAMAGMLVPRLNPMPDSAWEGIFAAATAWFACRIYRQVRRRGRGSAAHHAPHLVHSAAMLYMLLAARAEASGSGMTRPSDAMTLQLPLVGLIFALTLLGYAVWDADLLTTSAPGPSPARIPAPMPARRLARLCRITLGITMSYTLVVML